jgi:hypothetical protein
MQVLSERRAWQMLLALAVCVFLGQSAMAHHGWGWATDEEFEISGKITNVRLGNPHGEVTLDVKGEKWLIEVGQPDGSRGGCDRECFGLAHGRPGRPHEYVVDDRETVAGHPARGGDLVGCLADGSHPGASGRLLLTLGGTRRQRRSQYYSLPDMGLQTLSHAK